MDTRVVISLIAIVTILVAVAVALTTRRRRGEQLNQRLVPKYDDVAVRQQSDDPRAEASLAEPEQHVEAFPLRALSPIDREGYAMEWATVQRRFVDEPSAAVGTADRLVGCVMIDRGYPMADFEHCAGDISVSYPTVVENYRAGHSIVMRHADGQATTEELRQAMMHYRTLFEELLQPEPASAKVQPIHQRRGGVSHERAS